MTDSKPLLSPPTSTDVDPVARRGSRARVAEVHAQTRRGLLVAAGFALVAVAAGLARVGAGWWLPLHLFVVGGLLSAISASTQMFAVTWSAAPAPRPVVAGTQRWALAAGSVALVFGRETDQTWLFVAGGGTVVIAMVALAVILIRVRRQAVTGRFAPAIEAYVTAVAAGVVGMSLGVVLGTGRTGGRAVELRSAHLVLNVLGLVGLVIVGSLPFFAATQVRSKMSQRATPTAMRLTFASLAAATALAATGAILDRPGVIAVGLIGYALGVMGVAATLPIYARDRLRWAGPRVLQLLTGLAWWVGMTAALALTGIQANDDRVILQALVVGGFAQILVASLAYLGPVLRGGGHQRLTAGFAITRSWLSLAAGNTAATAALVGHGPTLAAALAVWLTDIVVRAARLLANPRSNANV